ncbi:hypothetical protein ACIP98_18795 [Streptomyces sp. NPDC088354]|uniref:hypothetical protein n=1 Tax=unclassified Streptomyces TaxID=2593676 RepID=UPI0029ACDBBE|nr:hypothetical protein [Streptomyces sp. MI02-7b]MDX3072643.1 hypothetical protein [Streptomyces sp. MI02-7b]
MSVIVRFFAAPDHQAAAAVVERGPEGVFESSYFGNFDPDEALVEWQGILTGRGFEELVAAGEPEVVAGPDDGEGPLLLAVSTALTEALAVAGPDRIAEAGRTRSLDRAADGEVIDPETAVLILGDLAALARGIGGRGHRLYCWTA